jgi:glycosyltransferase involved in cell wall biosynthesis
MSLQHWPEWVPNVSQSKHVEWMKRETEIYANAQYVFTWSEFARNSVISDYGISPDSVIATGAGANFTNASIKDKRYDTQIALFVGYEFERKGGKVLLDSWRDVHAALPDAKLYMVGPPDRSKIETPGVVWLGNVTDRAKLKGLYEQATVFVMPSIFEPWGHVFTEAMGMGLACVGNRSCAMPEIIDHDETGYLVPPGDTEALAECLIRVLSSTETAARFGRNAYNKMKSAGGWKDVIDVMSDYLVKATL